MAFRFVLNFANTSHRFIKTAKVTLTLDGAAQAETKESKLGAHIWDLAAAGGQKIVLDITIPEPPGSGLGRDLFKLNQPLDVVLDPSTGLRLDPNNADGHWKTFFNPRLTGQWVGAGAGRRFEVNADLTFLDVTDYFQSVTHAKGPGNPGLDLYKKLGPVVPVDQKTTLRPPTPPDHYNVRLRMLEFTGGQPVTWAVLIPDSVKDASNIIHTLMFFRPGMADVYTNTDNLQIRDMIRYTTDPIHEDTPFYAQDPLAKNPKDQAHWIPYPECAWEKQLSKAQKCVLFVHPFPHGTGFGVAATAVFPTLLGSICKILWADKTIATAVFTGLHIGRIALSGFSKGGDALYQALGANPAKIDELYLFDPNGTGNNVGIIAAWFARKNKKLRMLGGFFQHTAMLDLEKQLKSADVFVRPSSKGFWGSSLSMYSVAVTPIKNGVRSTIELVNVPSGNPAKEELSAKSKIFFVRDNNDGSVEIEAELSSGKRVRRVIPDCIRNEVAAQIHVQLDVALNGKVVLKATKDADGKPVPAGSIQFTTASGKVKFFKPDFLLKLPMTTEADVDHNVKVFVQITKDTRHQWPVVGGDDFNVDTNRGITFVGYLQQCLTASSFT